MQIDNKFNPALHERFKALSVKQPYADLLTQAISRDDNGYHAAKTIEVRTRPTKFRGDLLICSSALPVIPGRISGAACGFVELYDIKKVEDFTPEDWERTCIPEKYRPKTGYGWLMRNPRRVVEIPVKGQLGIWNLVVPKDDIMCYPREVAIGAELYKKLRYGHI